MEDKKLNEMLEKICASLTDEQNEKIKDCDNVQELCDALSKMDVDLPDELLNFVSGGAGYLGQVNITYEFAVCTSCGDEFKYPVVYIQGRRTSITQTICYNCRR